MGLWLGFMLLREVMRCVSERGMSWGSYDILVYNTSLIITIYQSVLTMVGFIAVRWAVGPPTRAAFT
jgi:hypothetical protein